MTKQDVHGFKLLATVRHYGSRVHRLLERYRYSGAIVFLPSIVEHIIV